MVEKAENIIENIERLRLLSDKYPNIQNASTELINLNAICNLPKGTEHFISDLHGEFETFRHIMNNASGTIREKVDLIYDSILSSSERDKLSTLIYYPQEKLSEITAEGGNTAEWYSITLNRLIEVCRLVSSKYTRSKVRKALPEDFAYIIEELLHNNLNDNNKVFYYKNIIDTIIKIDRADAFIVALCSTIKRLAVDHLHIVGDIFDRGSRADLILDYLMDYHSLDIEWGNHDVLWMGAASGSEACIAVALNNSINYNNFQFLEEGYGINLRPLALFSAETYKNSEIDCFIPNSINNSEKYSLNDVNITAKMNKAITVIRLKLEGQIIKRHPEFNMNDRLILDKIDYDKASVNINGKTYKMKDSYFPTVDKYNPYELSAEETVLINQLKSAFLHSEKLQKHMEFLYNNGSLYKIYNSNLLLHGCIPLNKDGSLMEFKINDFDFYGKELLDYMDFLARTSYYSNQNSAEKLNGQDYLWFLWCGKNSPLFGKDKMTTFERLFIDDSKTWEEEKNAYYKFSERQDGCIKLLKAFGLKSDYSHIINGHVPVRSKDGQKPIRANGRLIVIDGGFCKAYQPTTGIAGYTLIYNSYGIRLCAHEPFGGIELAVKNNTDIHSTSVISEKVVDRIKVGQTDKGKQILSTINDLNLLISAYRQGLIKERFYVYHKELV